MSQSLIRSRAMITRTLDRFRCEEIAGGAILQEDGVITAIGTFEYLHAKYPQVPVLGSGNDIMLPGFVNAHHHVGLTAVQLGAPDLPLELWFVARMLIRSVDTYLDTLYSAFEMIASGVTTVQHIHGWVPGAPSTEAVYPCGTQELAMEVAELVRRSPDPGHAVVGLMNHGLTITGESLDEILERVGPHIVRRVPMS